MIYMQGVSVVLFLLAFPFAPQLAAGFALVVLLAHLPKCLRLSPGPDGSASMQTIVWTGIFSYCLQINALVNHLASL